MFLFFLLPSSLMSMDEVSNAALNFYKKHLITTKQKPVSDQVVVKKENGEIVIVADIVFSYSSIRRSVKTMLSLAAVISPSKTTPNIEQCRFILENILFCQGTPYHQDGSIFYQVAYNPTIITDNNDDDDNNNMQKNALEAHIIECGFPLHSRSEKIYQYPLFLDIGPAYMNINVIEFIGLPHVLKAIIQVSSGETFSKIAKVINWSNVVLPCDYKKFKAHPWNPHYRATSFASMPKCIQKLCNKKYNEQICYPQI